MRYQPTINIWELTAVQRARLQPGQWIKAGRWNDASKGQYMGQTLAGVDVVCWLGGNYTKKRRKLRDFAITRGA